MAEPVLFVESARKADDHRVTFENGSSNFFLPIIARLKLLRVEPRTDFIPDQSLMKFVNREPVAVRVDEKDNYLF
jgi:hypothetical protein